MELRHLRYFVAVAETGSITRAAERLHIQQPPLGQQIRALEQELGVNLFDRRPRHIELNANGRRFLDHARMVLRHAEDARHDVARFALGERGEIALGMTSSASLHPAVPAMLRNFHRTYPDAHVAVRESETYELVTALKEGEIDAALFHVSQRADPQLDEVTLAQVNLVAAVPIDHPLANSDDPVSFERLCEEDWVIYRRRDGSGIFDALARELAQRQARPNFAAEVTRLMAAINLVAAGRGISLVPETMQALHPEAVRYRPLEPDTIAPLPLTLAYRRRHNLALLDNFLACVVI